jgi:nitroreductase
MDVYQAIRVRRSVRSYREEPVEEEKIARIFEAVRLAPSARNDQEWRFIAVRAAAARRRIAHEAAGQPFVGQAPVIVVCCAQTDGRVMRCGQPAYTVDVAIAVDHLTLAAAAEGLGTCWIGSFDEQLVREILGIPAAVRVVTITPLGYPRDPGPVEKRRLGLSEILRYERW